MSITSLSRFPTESITYVSAFYDIGRKSQEWGIRFDNYFEFVERLLNQDVNLIFFTTRALHDRLTYVPRSNLIFVFEDSLPGEEHLPAITRAWKRFLTNRPDKDTPIYGCLTVGKFAWIKRAIQLNPFNSTHFGWIDAALLKIARQPELLPLLQPPEKIRWMLTNHIDLMETLNPSFVITCRYKIAGGLFIGPKDLMEICADRLLATVKRLLALGYHGLDQEYMAIVYARDPSIFDPYYGDYTELLQNYHRCTQNYHFVWRILKNARQNGDEIEAVKVATYIAKSQKLGLEIPLDHHLEIRSMLTSNIDN